MVMFVSYDVETTGRCDVPGVFPATPFDTRNVVLLSGWEMPIKTTHTHGRASLPSALTSSQEEYIMATHNGVFDMHYVRRFTQLYNNGAWAGFIYNLNWWDTQVADYVLSGQFHKMSSLDDAYALTVGGPKQKMSEVSEMIKAGKIEEVEETALREYLQIDLEMTRELAETQYAKATPDQRRLIFMMSEFMKAIEEMEWNGMYVNPDKLAEYTVRSTVIEESNTKLLRDAFVQLVTVDYGLTAKGDFEPPNDTVQTLGQAIVSHTAGIPTPSVLSALLFGGTVKIEFKTHNGYYKSGKKAGQPRVKWVRSRVTLPGIFGDPETYGSTRNKNGLWSVDADVLKNLLSNIIEPSLRNVLAYWLEAQEISKHRRTYIDGLTRLMAIPKPPEIPHENLIHHSINNTATGTGRTSCSKPNLQNVPMSPDNPESVFNKLPIKALFESRYGSEGGIVEIDFKQLEVIALAAITQDPQLVVDLKNGVDIHQATAEAVWGKGKVTKEQRRVAKTINFGLIYGGGAEALAKQAGCLKATAQKIISAFYDRYSTIKPCFENWMANAPYCGPTGTFNINLGYGRSWAVPMNNYDLKPAYTKFRNYPVQGLATADFVPIMVTAIFRAMLKAKMNGTLSDTCLMVNTVHDSVIFDMEINDFQPFLDVVRPVLDNAHEVFRAATGSDIFNGLPLKYEVTAGPDWEKQLVAKI